LADELMSAPAMGSRSVTPPPRVVAISGVVFAALDIASLTLIRLAVPADPREPGAWLADPVFRSGVRLALELIPFTGLAFLWFIAVLRNRIGALEDRFFATVLLGSGLLYIAMLFAAAAVAHGLANTDVPPTALPGPGPTYTLGRGMTHALMNTFGMRMAAVFMFASSMIGLRTAFLARWLSVAGFVCGLVLLLAITDFAWIALVFPGWVLLVSTWILVTEFRRIPAPLVHGSSSR
jgi:hypothetical protein